MIKSDLLEDKVTPHACNGKCIQCGECCTNFLPITKKEVAKIKQYIKEHDIKAENRIIENNIILQCPFLNQKTKKCNIYEARPFVCRNFLCSHKDWKKRRMLYMQRADYNGIDKKGNITPVYSTDELFFNDLRFFLYNTNAICRKLFGEVTKENFELVIRTSKREELISFLKYTFEEEEKCQKI